MEVILDEKLTYDLYLESHFQYLYAEALLLAFKELFPDYYNSSFCLHQDIIRLHYDFILQQVSVRDILSKWRVIANGMKNVQPHFLVTYEIKLFSEECHSNLLHCHSWGERMIRMVTPMKNLENIFPKGMAKSKKQLLLEKYYFSVNHPASFSSVQKRYRVLQKKYPGNFSKPYLRKWFNGIDAYSVQKQV